MMAAGDGSLEITKLLIEKGAGVNEAGRQFEQTALRAIITPSWTNREVLDETKTRIAALLLCSGANTEGTDPNSPILQAAQELLQKARAGDVMNVLNAAAHPRLGANSPLKVLPLEIRTKIGDYYAKESPQLGIVEEVGSDAWKNIVSNILDYRIGPEPSVTRVVSTQLSPRAAEMSRGVE